METFHARCLENWSSAARAYHPGLCSDAAVVKSQRRPDRPRCPVDTPSASCATPAGHLRPFPAINLSHAGHLCAARRMIVHSPDPPTARRPPATSLTDPSAARRPPAVELIAPALLGR